MLDAHQHFWKVSRGDYTWLKPGMRSLNRDFQPEDLAPALLSCAIAGTVIVQAAPTEAETLYLLDLASRWQVARAVVGWTDLNSAHSAETLERLARNRLLRGIRPMIQDEPDADWLLRPAVSRSLEVLRELGLTFDALVRPRQLAALALAVDNHPELSVVIDHAGKPDIAAGRFEGWSRDIQELSARSHVRCKLSGLLSEAGDKNADAHLRPYIDHLVECFGPARLMWGSDWPVLVGISDYQTWFKQSQRLLQGMSADEHSLIFGGTASRFYGIEESS